MHEASFSYTSHFQEQDDALPKMHPQPLSEVRSAHSNLILQALSYTMKLQDYYMHHASLPYIYHFQEQGYVLPTMQPQPLSEG